MIFIFRLLIATLTIFICVGCKTNSPASIDNFSEVAYSPQYATGFEVCQDDSQNTLLRVTRPWQGNNIEEQHLAIFASAEAAAHYEGQHIVGAAERIVCMSTSHIAMLDALGLSDRIVGVSGKQYVMNEAVANNPNVADVGYDSNLNYELLVTLRPDIVLMYGVSAENSAVTAKLRSLNIPYIYLGDYTELSPLGKAEWIVAIAEITGYREAGIAYIEGVAERYNAVRNGITRGETPKRIMLNTPYEDVWYMPSDDSYLVQLIEDAGGTYIYKGMNPSGGSRGISLEEAYRLVSEADIWLNVGQCRTLSDLSNSAPHFMATDVVKRGDVYNNNRRQSAAGGSDFWESAIVRPDVVLSDIAKIVAGDDTDLYYHCRLN
ncbi:MAG: ABC transporter substrate-binding protein [Alistipes sp.]|nr:ABC transporter substrate-binding protein [Alistipes sp.]